MSEAKETGYPSIDQPWKKYYIDSSVSAEAPNLSIFENIWEHNKEHLADTALNYFKQKISYRTMFDEIENCARALKQANIKKGEFVTICSAGIPEAVYIVLACSKIGAIANLVNPLFTTDQMTERINETGSTIIFVLDRLFGCISGAISATNIQKVIILNATRSLSLPKRWLAPKIKRSNMLKKLKHISAEYDDFLSDGELYTDMTTIPYQRAMPVLMVYSSGTTGASKGILLTNDGVNATISHYSSPEFTYTRGMTFLQMIPVWFSTGIVLSVFMPLCLGITVIPEPAFTKESFTADIAKYKPNMTLATMSFWGHAIHEKKLRNIDLSFLFYPITGGEQVLPQAELKVNTFLKSNGCSSKLIKGWGMCELGSTITSTSPSHSKLGSAGYPIKGVKVIAFDREKNEEMSYGERGELYVSSPSRMKEYYQNEAATNEFFWKDDNDVLWGRTGDVGYVDQDGDVFIEGRTSDYFIARNGQKIFLFDSEAVILSDSAIAQCKVVATEIGEDIISIAHIVLKPENNNKTEDIIQRLDNQCQMKLSEVAIPKAYKVRNVFPVHANGKRDIEQLKLELDNLMDGRGKPVDVHCLSDQNRNALISKDMNFAEMGEKFILPFYINTDRLLDLCAIQNNGYVDFAEITETKQSDTDREKSGRIEAGVKLWRIADLNASVRASKIVGNEFREKKHHKLVQTAASMLHFFLRESGAVISRSLSTGNTGSNVGTLVAVQCHLVEPHDSAEETVPAYFDKIRNKSWRKKLEQLYSRFNGISDRAPLYLEMDYFFEDTQNWVQPEKISLYTQISRKYLYQCELNDLWDLDLICLCKITALGTHPKAEIIALFC